MYKLKNLKYNNNLSRFFLKYWYLFSIKYRYLFSIRHFLCHVLLPYFILLLPNPMASFTLSIPSLNLWSNYLSYASNHYVQIGCSTDTSKSCFSRKWSLCFPLALSVLSQILTIRRPLGGRFTSLLFILIICTKSVCKLYLLKLPNSS